MAAHAKPPPARPATRADLEALPPNVKGEILDGVLYTQARPRPRHQGALLRMGAGLDGSFGQGRGGPGGWWILPEPGIELPGAPEVSPDLAGWRRERLPELPDAAITVVPDWVCEILSPTTRAYDLRIKRPFYARAGVRWLWYVDLEARTLTVSRLEDGRWSELGVWGEDDRVRAEPFDAIEIALEDWWGAPPASAAAPEPPAKPEE
jgi:Uma2 family endonuclease